MSQNYYIILTLIGEAKVAEAIAEETTISLTELAVGDAEYTPSKGQTSLVNEQWRDSLNSLSRDAENQNYVVAEAVIPAEDGGWNVCEVGVFDGDGDLFAIGKYPKTYKPVLAEGSGKDLYIRFIMEVTSEAEVNLMIDPAVVLATRKYVDDKLEDEKNAHKYDHDQTVKNSEWVVEHNLGRSAIPVVEAYKVFPAGDTICCDCGIYCGDSYCGNTIEYTTYEHLPVPDIRIINGNVLHLVFSEAVKGKATIIL